MIKKFTLGLAVVLALFVIACGSPTKPSTGNEDVPSSPEHNAALHDVKLLSCSPGGLGGGFIAKLTVSNLTADAQSYTIMVEAVDAKKNRLGEAHAIVNTLRAGQSTNVDAQGMLDTPASKFTCNVVTVDRLPI